jgi:hypothetical protein
MPDMPPPLRNTCPVIALAALAAGCCGMRYPSQREVNRLFAQMPAGTPGTDAFPLLKTNGYSPAYKSPHKIVGEKGDYCLTFAQSLIISVTLDDNGQNFP